MPSLINKNDVKEIVRGMEGVDNEEKFELTCNSVEDVCAKVIIARVFNLIREAEKQIRGGQPSNIKTGVENATYDYLITRESLVEQAIDILYADESQVSDKLGKLMVNMGNTFVKERSQARQHLFNRAIMSLTDQVYSVEGIEVKEKTFPFFILEFKDIIDKACSKMIEEDGPEKPGIIVPTIIHNENKIVH